MITTVSLKDVLLDSTKEVFETMVFMAVEESLQEETGMGEQALLGTITFKGRLEGCLGICCGQACARTIAASMLGMASVEELGESDVGDAIGEIANMVLGAVKRGSRTTWATSKCPSRPWSRAASCGAAWAKGPTGCGCG